MPDKNKNYVSGINSLWDVVDKTKTAIGKRFLRDNLLNPIIAPLYHLSRGRGNYFLLPMLYLATKFQSFLSLCVIIFT